MKPWVDRDEVGHLERIETQGLAYYRLPRWKTLRHGIFTRHGGVSATPFASLNMGGNVGDTPQAVRENHERMFAALRVEDARVCSVWQVHSANVIIANKPIQGRRWLAQADGMVTDQPDIPLSMRFADCTPLLFHDPARGVIGIAHAGWRGTIQGVGSQTVRTMQKSFGCRPSDIEAWIGPSIGPDYYQVGEEVVAAVQSWFGSTNHLIRRSAADGTAYLDLWAANALDLQRVGIEHIEIAGLCTATHTRDFFSHRAERGTTGRFGAVICL